MFFLQLLFLNITEKENNLVDIQWKGEPLFKEPHPNLDIANANLVMDISKPFILSNATEDLPC